MSQKLSSFDTPKRDFELNEIVSFTHEGQRLVGTVARVYSTRDDYHVEVNGERYSVNRDSDDMQLVGEPDAIVQVIHDEIERQAVERGDHFTSEAWDNPSESWTRDRIAFDGQLDLRRIAQRILALK